MPANKLSLDDAITAYLDGTRETTKRSEDFAVFDDFTSSVESVAEKEFGASGIHCRMELVCNTQGVCEIKLVCDF
ncbi:hypothetical protein ACFPER_02355 [Agromyces aurantiacus]|uniref:Uncharacterized protein n=1 Tax=Agromyces aurantiacus TaxID=165814 RepID=A0ABV9R0K4_9MICO|nr:hypothetical protein [Agromyces aurantiacus]MBM7505929.1 hypothetical protein [Agromyces aurantiacus]